VAANIVNQPLNQTVVAGQNASFSVIAWGTQPISYQWWYDSTNPIAGATNATFALNNVQSTNAGTYSVAVSNAGGGMVSSNATLTVYSPVITPSGLVSWWRGEANTLDSVGSNPGTLTGNATYAPGEVGQGFSFSAPGDYVLITNSLSLQVQDLTIEAWIKRSSTTVIGNGNGNILAYGPGGYAFWMNGGKQPILSIGAQADAESTGAMITDTNFHHVAVTKSGSTVIFYVDGVASAPGTLTGSFTFTTPLCIGANGSFQDTFLGTIDEVSLYNRALSPSEIQSIYAAGSAGKFYPVAPPILTITLGNTNVTLTWPTTAGNFTLQTVGGNLPPASGWSNAPAGATNGANIQVTLTPGSQSQFFRLYHP
jgi:hypothetical protein